LVYSTFIGEPGIGGCRIDGLACGLAVDSSGDAYIAGTVNYDASSFPTTPNAFQTSCHPASNSFSSNGFVTKLNATGDGLIYSTCFGTNTYAGIAPSSLTLDSSGRAYIAGTIQGSPPGGLPTTPGAFQPNPNPNSQAMAFLSVFDPSISGSAGLIYSTYFGGSMQDHGDGIAVDAFGMAYVTGTTYSSDMPTTPGAYQTALAGTTNAFGAKFNPALSGAASLIYSTHLGGSGEDYGLAIAVDTLGNAYIAGDGATTFPTTPGSIQSTARSGLSSTAKPKSDRSTPLFQQVAAELLSSPNGHLFTLVNLPVSVLKRPTPLVVESKCRSA
jgi:hypothetical protein